MRQAIVLMLHLVDRGRLNNLDKTLRMYTRNYLNRNNWTIITKVKTIMIMGILMGILIVSNQY